ncbi:hypothetical protein [Moorena sp. SIO3I6]|uniref:hypothetical protein n=1 Tax=Moorena sp. SIO3I6 TaxID=2607831 RepID=UPI0013F8D611|nr:hypothetical protein [Moorena sp. SIO3I6]NEP29692.1 hypothetical protein [Moorena sp. SIO3I6]
MQIKEQREDFMTVKSDQQLHYTDKARINMALLILGKNAQTSDLGQAPVGPPTLGDFQSLVPPKIGGLGGQNDTQPPYPWIVCVSPEIKKLKAHCFTAMT